MVFYESRKSDVACLGRKLRLRLLVYIIDVKPFSIKKKKRRINYDISENITKQHTGCMLRLKPN